MGRYAIYDEIASGGMASVHFARLVGPGNFARTAAVKRLHRHLAHDREFALMFINEGRLAARIRHPNVVSIIDVIKTRTDLMLVMEYVHGEPLARLLAGTKERNQRVPLPIAAQIMVDTLHGLHAAHEATDEQGQPLGIVHRDVSPQNILIGVDGIARLVDFGLAKAVMRHQQISTSPWAARRYAYMAPEQVNRKPVTRVSDTFAAAIVLWELLTGEWLFAGGTDAEVMERVLSAPIDSPTRFIPDLPPPVAAILEKGLSRDPLQRYQTAREMALDLEACVPAVRRTELAAWVAKIAGEELAQRAAILGEIEKRDHEVKAVPLQRLEPAPSSPGSGSTAQGREEAEARAEPWSEGTISLDRSGERDRVAIVAEPQAPEQRARSMPRTIKVAIGVAVPMMVLVAWMVLSPRHHWLAPPAPALSASTRLTSPPSLPGVVTPEGADGPGAVAATVASTTPAAPTSGASARPPAKAAPLARQPASTEGVDCSTPYWIDSNGRKHYNAACL